MYTELHFNAELRDPPEEVIAALKTMLGEIQDGDDEVALPDHGLFKKRRWRQLLTCDSYYFSADTHSTLRWDKISAAWFLCVRSNLKNYEGEIEAFIDWIDPYLAKHPGDFLGFYRYEEAETPTLIYKQA